MTDKSASMRVRGERVLADIASLAQIGAAPSGGVTRPAYSDADVTARAIVRDMMEAAGLDVRIDPAGNTFGRRAGTERDLAPLIIGSHTDTVPNGGKFDGALGVLAAIEVARTLREHDVRLRHPLEVVDFQNEEGGLIGSKIVAGRLAPGTLDLVATSGYEIGEGIERLGGDPRHLEDARRASGNVAGYLELHIEQGRVLERAAGGGGGGAQIGVVEGLVGIRYWEVTFDGVASHAGTTPMADRHDALLAAARFVDAVHTVVTSTAGRQVGTVGRLAVFPGGANVIPGRAVLTLELRDLDLAVTNALFERIETEGRRIAEHTGTRLTITATLTNEPSLTHPSVQRAVVQAADALSLRSHHMASGAGHDAQNMASIGPAGMIFVPSVNGISHSPDERTEDADVVNGANVLLGALLTMDDDL